LEVLKEDIEEQFEVRFIGMLHQGITMEMSFVVRVCLKKDVDIVKGASRQPKRRHTKKKCVS
jgi:hypothetical protein